MVFSKEVLDDILKDYHGPDDLRVTILKIKSFVSFSAISA